jgi:hypothetical protein
MNNVNMVNITEYKISNNQIWFFLLPKTHKPVLLFTFQDKLLNSKSYIYKTENVTITSLFGIVQGTAQAASFKN